MNENEGALIAIAAGDSAKLRLHLDGGHVVSWSPAGADDERLFVSARSGYGPGIAIRGGIPVCFPQFGGRGALPQHGFARTNRWTLVEKHEGADSAFVTVRLRDNDSTRALWPHRFTAELTARIGGDTLETTLDVHNDDDAPWAFTGALHTYFRVSDAFRSRIEGLERSAYLDALAGGATTLPSGSPLAIDGSIDRVYLAVATPVTLDDPAREQGARRVEISQSGFRDVVVWNPGVDGVRAKADFAEGDERRMVCIEAAIVAEAETLRPGDRWSGAQTVRCR